MNKSELQAVYERIAPHMHRTPVMTSSTFNRMTGADIYFKCENFQKGGSFKIRGATNAIFALTEEERARGVTAHSSGNFGQAVALAASRLGVQATIVMPEDAPKVKVAAVQGYGGKVILCKPTQDAREAKVEEIVTTTGATKLHPFNQWPVIHGQSTIATELLDQVKDLDYIFAPIGGGGLIAGIALACRALRPECKVMGGEPATVDEAYRSWKSGKLLRNDGDPDTIADGLKANLGDLPYPIIRDHVSDIILVTEEEIKTTWKMVIQRMKLVIEPSCAVPVAALLKESDRFRGKRVGMVLSGGNVDL